MKMRASKLYSCLLALAMLLGCLGLQAAADTENETMSEEMKGRVEVLRMLEIIPDYYDYNVNVNDKVTRADFVSAAAKLINCAEYNGEPYYYDVPQTHWAYNEICALTSLGVLSGDSGKLFSPDRTVTKTEAYKIIMMVLGYEPYAQSSGGYPGGYLSAAAQSGVADGVSSNEEITLGDMFIILYNALTAPVMKNTSFTSTPVYEIDENDSVLGMYRSIYKETGTVTGAGGVTLNGDELSIKNVTIDDVVYTSDVDISGYLGEEIEFFYHNDTQNNEKNVLWARLTGRTEVLNISANNDSSFDKTSYVLTYSDGQRYKNIEISRSCVLVFNGRAASGDLSDIFNLPKYEAKLIKTDSSAYDIAIVDAYENYMVKSINESNFTIYDKLVPGRSLNLDETAYEHFEMNMLGTKTMTFGELAENNVLSVYKSLDGEVMNVSVSAESVSGVVDSMSEDDFGITLRINSEEYFMPSAAVEHSPVKPASGRNVKLYLDISGEAAYCEIVDSQFVPMYLINVWLDDMGGETMEVKYLNSDGDLTKSKCAEKIMIDASPYDDMSIACRQFMGDDGKCKPQFVLGKLNSDGEITAFDTAAVRGGGSDDLLSVSIPYKSGLMYKSDGLLNTFGVINETTFIFSVPLDQDIEKASDYEFKVIEKTDIPNDSYLNFETYKTKDEVGFEQYVVIKGSSGAALSNSELPILVDSFATVVNDEGEIVEQLKGWQGATRLSINSDGAYSFADAGIGNGDVIRVYKNSSGDITNTVMCFDYSENAVSGTAPAFNALYSTAVGYVNEVVDDVVRIGYASPETVDITLFGTNVPILVCDSQNTINGKPEVYKGTLDDARTYMNAGSECSKIFVVQTRSAPKLFIIYN